MYDLLEEPFHLHVSDDQQKLCKYWILTDGTVELADVVGYSRRELRKIEEEILTQMPEIRKQYESYCRQNFLPINYKIAKKK